jgi:hypothetical protein
MNAFKSQEINFHGFFMSFELVLVTLTNKLTDHLPGQILKKNFKMSDHPKERNLRRIFCFSHLTRAFFKWPLLWTY